MATKKKAAQKTTKKAAKKARRSSADTGVLPDDRTLEAINVLSKVFSMLEAKSRAAGKRKGRTQGFDLLNVLEMLDSSDDSVEQPQELCEATSNVYRIKITLLGSSPPIWRRIEVEDCSLSSLHHYIQGAMGWGNYHLYQFKVGKEYFSDPENADDGYCEDAQSTFLSEIVPENKRRFRFRYEYDFGDSWDHEILVEKCLPEGEEGVSYPRCTAGARACPPEDVGGVYGYEEYLEAIANPQDERHEELVEWGGPFDAEKFDVETATGRMQ